MSVARKLDEIRPPIPTGAASGTDTGAGPVLTLGAAIAAKAASGQNEGKAGRRASFAAKRLLAKVRGQMRGRP